MVATSIFLYSNKGKGDKNVANSSFDVIDDAFAIIKEEGVYPVEGELLIEGALRGMTEVIGDPYSTYLSKEEAAAHEESLAGERIGIGAEITRSNGKFIIVAPLKSSPADKAGLRPYDEIIRIDGKPLDGGTLQDVVQKIRGKKGTAVTMTIYRPELNKHLEISIIRDIIPVTTVSSKIIEEKERKVGYISITTFGSETAKEWAIATENLIGDGAEAIVIDVRGNPGGYLHSVGTILSSLLQEDTVYAYLQDATGALTPLLAAKDEKIKFNSQLKMVPLVLLQDKGSASASEMLSGALKDLRRASIAGTESFGKGTVQDTKDLANGGKVKLSTAKWLTPKEKWIHGKGVEADLKIDQNELLEEHVRLVSDEYNEGDFADDIAYSQRLLAGLGYSTGRDDGYFDEGTTEAVKEFQVFSKVKESGKMDRQFFTALQKEIVTYRENKENDVQLQMGLDYLLHLLKEN
ncbi:S41 family peptidase [Sporosarcina sp. Marseille-Q4063]|uniref:S41 family peptidase n=1 Tax=Sporosarcina sp. Marseille-Q4063 TaxID=2810514 RepID=UPI001BAF6DD1|nr:S41 family peptidase [Sporosarcina sp. Marseille-Q4063]QUW21650.1 S41 family peptidase [Sporosarcina sp. Marseille-Q4063]